MGKGDYRRPQLISDEEMKARWDAAFRRPEQPPSTEQEGVCPEDSSHQQVDQKES